MDTEQEKRRQRRRKKNEDEDEVGIVAIQFEDCNVQSGAINKDWRGGRTEKQGKLSEVGVVGSSSAIIQILRQKDRHSHRLSLSLFVFSIFPFFKKKLYIYIYEIPKLYAEKWEGKKVEEAFMSGTYCTNRGELV